MSKTKTHQCELSEEVLQGMKTIVTAALQVKQPNVSREDILKALNDLPTDLLLQAQEDLNRILSGQEVVL